MAIAEFFCCVCEKLIYRETKNGSLGYELKCCNQIMYKGKVTKKQLQNSN